MIALKSAMFARKTVEPWDYRVEYIYCYGYAKISTGISSSTFGNSLRIVSKVGSSAVNGRHFYWGYDPSYNTYFERNDSRLGTNPVLVDASQYLGDGKPLINVDWTQTTGGMSTKIQLGAEVVNLSNTSYTGMPSGKELTLFSIGPAYGWGVYNKIGETDVYTGGVHAAHLVPCVIDGSVAIYDTVRKMSLTIPGGAFTAGPRI